MARDLLDSIYGSLIAGAIGDALGSPTEGMYWTDIREKYRHTDGRITELEPGSGQNTGAHYGETSAPQTPPGTFTDDTTLRYYLCMAILRAGGRVTPDEFAAVWLDHLNPDRFWLNERLVLTKLRIGMNPWDSGKSTPPTGCATMAISPVGIVNAGNPRQAYQDAFNIAFVNQDNADRDAAATAAAAVAAAFLPDATPRSVIETMLHYSSSPVKRTMILALDLIDKSQDIDQFAERFYGKMLDWTWPQFGWTKERFFSGSSLEILPLTAASILFTDGDVNQSMIEAASLGRDCDTTASLAGCITGVLQGAASIRPDWIETVEKNNAAFFQEAYGESQANFRFLAEQLLAVMHAEKRKAEQRVAQLSWLLEKSTPSARE
jgi:ADP-ribosylglycohydrolase